MLSGLLRGRLMDAAPLLWWLALVIQVLAIPGALLPVLPGLALLPLGALLWMAAVGWAAGWPPLLLAAVLLLLGWGAEALALVLGPARLQASRWAPIGAGVGVVWGVVWGVGVRGEVGARGKRRCGCAPPPPPPPSPRTPSP